MYVVNLTDAVRLSIFGGYFSSIFADKILVTPLSYLTLQSLADPLTPTKRLQFWLDKVQVNCGKCWPSALQIGEPLRIIVTIRFRRIIPKLAIFINLRYKDNYK
jgi:hypothetical protein